MKTMLLNKKILHYETSYFAFFLFNLTGHYETVPCTAIEVNSGAHEDFKSHNRQKMVRESNQLTSFWPYRRKEDTSK